MSAGVDSRGMFTVLLIAPERNGWAAPIIRTWAGQAMLRLPFDFPDTRLNHEGRAKP